MDQHCEDQPLTGTSTSANVSTAATQQQSVSAAAVGALTNVTTSRQSSIETSSSSSSATTRPICQNPYTQRRKAPPTLSRRPLHDYDNHKYNHPPSSATVTVTATVQTDNPKREISTLERGTDTSKDNRTVGLEPVSNSYAQSSTSIMASTGGTSHANNVDTPVESIATSTEPISLELPLWKRLPSRTISFGSAEILSVLEFAKNTQTNTLPASVRLTGVLLQKHVHQSSDTTNGLTFVSLLLGDPLLRPSATKHRQGRTLAQTTTTKPSRSFMTSPRTTSSLGHRSTQRMNPQMSPIPAANRRQGGGLWKRPRTSLTRTASTAASSTSVTSVERFAQQVYGSLTDATTSCRVWVIANPDFVSLDECIVGDLVMVMGETYKCLLNNPTTNHDTPIRNETTSVEEIMTLVRQKHSTLDNSTLTSKTDQVSYLVPRIVRNVKGANMTLYMKSLQARREMLQKKF